MKRLLVAAAANYVALHGRRTQLAFAAATSTDHSRHPAEPVDPPPVRVTAASALTRYWAIAVSHR
jgi:hypothetical protein